MRSAMDSKTYLNFYKNTVLGYSNNLQSYICKLLENENRITFEEQCSLNDREDTLFIQSKKDYKGIIARTASDKQFSDFYEKLEFIKLYKYSVPLFYEMDQKIELKDLMNQKAIKKFEVKEFKSDYVIGVNLKDTEPLYWENGNNIFIKFVLQKTYLNPESFDMIDYRYPIVIYINEQKGILEIRYDSTKYNSQFDNMSYEKLVSDCIEWLREKLEFKMYLCKHENTISIINDDSHDENVKIYKQMMEMSSGGAAELTAAESTDYVLPFIGEIRGLIEENEELFNEAREAKKLLLQYLSDKEATASYPYIYIKWVKPVESQSYIVRVTFDYLNHKYTLLQHITGVCKDLGMERMNDAIKYLCESGAFIKGEKI